MGHRTHEVRRWKASCGTVSPGQDTEGLIVDAEVRKPRQRSTQGTRVLQEGLWCQPLPQPPWALMQPG